MGTRGAIRYEQPHLVARHAAPLGRRNGLP
jgi:hypothetical protein